jgi:hypothetical protein
MLQLPGALFFTWVGSCNMKQAAPLVAHTHNCTAIFILLSIEGWCNQMRWSHHALHAGNETAA